MRLIDAKVATNAIGSINNGMPHDDKDDIVEKAIGIIDHLPTVDAVPVVYGRWERTDIISAGLLLINGQNIVEHRCSVCDRYSILFEGHIEENFCPYCGAKMDEMSE